MIRPTRLTPRRDLPGPDDAREAFAHGLVYGVCLAASLALVLGVAAAEWLR